MRSDLLAALIALALVAVPMPGPQALLLATMLGMSGLTHLRASIVGGRE